MKFFREENEIVQEGLFTCPKCARYYPIITGIPIMSPDKFRKPDFERPFLEKWKDHLPKDLSQGKEIFRIGKK